jgi:hypothetical protein
MPIPEVNESRQREHVAVETSRGRRRRRSGSLNRMHQLNLDCIPPQDLDLENYVYRWVKDENSRVYDATHADDYEFVTSQELGGRNFVDQRRGGDASFIARADSESESDDRVRKFAETDKHGRPVFNFLVKKRRDYHEADYNEIVAEREAMMEGRVYHAQLDPDTKEGDLGDMVYVPKGVQIGHAAQRRKTPITRTLQGKV